MPHRCNENSHQGGYGPKVRFSWADDQPYSGDAFIAAQLVAAGYPDKNEAVQRLTGVVRTVVPDGVAEGYA
jgi:hypothetical protein